MTWKRVGTGETQVTEGSEHHCSCKCPSISSSMRTDPGLLSTGLRLYGVAHRPCAAIEHLHLLTALEAWPHRVQRAATPRFGEHECASIPNAVISRPVAQTRTLLAIARTLDPTWLRGCELAGEHDVILPCQVVRGCWKLRERCARED